MKELKNIFLKDNFKNLGFFKIEKTQLITISLKILKILTIFKKVQNTTNNEATLNQKTKVSFFDKCPISMEKIHLCMT